MHGAKAVPQHLDKLSDPELSPSTSCPARRCLELQTWRAGGRFTLLFAIALLQSSACGVFSACLRMRGAGAVPAVPLVAPRGHGSVARLCPVPPCRLLITSLRLLRGTSYCGFPFAFPIFHRCPFGGPRRAPKGTVTVKLDCTLFTWHPCVCQKPILIFSLNEGNIPPISHGGSICSRKQL